jgi:hypothetical protein
MSNDEIENWFAIHAEGCACADCLWAKGVAPMSQKPSGDMVLREVREQVGSGPYPWTQIGYELVPVGLVELSGNGKPSAWADPINNGKADPESPDGEDDRNAHDGRH